MWYNTDKYVTAHHHFICKPGVHHSWCRAIATCFVAILVACGMPSVAVPCQTGALDTILNRTQQLLHIWIWFVGMFCSLFQYESNSRSQIFNFRPYVWDIGEKKKMPLTYMRAKIKNSSSGVWFRFKFWTKYSYTSSIGAFVVEFYSQ